MFVRTSMSVRPLPVSGSAASSSRVRRSRGAGSPLARSALPGLDQLVDRLLEEADRGTRPRRSAAPSPGSRRCRAVDSPQAVEVAGDGAAQRIRVLRHPVGEDRPLQHVEGDPGHFERGIDHAAARTPLPAPDDTIGGLDHGRKEAARMARREDRRDGAALEPPFVALGRHQSRPSPAPGIRICRSSFR